MAVTNNIREIREQRGIYQDDLAAAIGYSTKTVGRIERGDSTPSAEFMLRISKYFNMLVEDVFHVEDQTGKNMRERPFQFFYYLMSLLNRHETMKKSL